jgi:hypothetical protein
MPAKAVVTTADPTVETTASPVKPAPPPTRTTRPEVGYAFFSQQINMKNVFEHPGWMKGLRGRGDQRRGPCPVHSQPGGGERTFPAHLGKSVFPCSQADCGVKGDVLDLWAAVHRLPLYAATLDLAETFRLRQNREEEPVARARRGVED